MSSSSARTRVTVAFISSSLICPRAAPSTEWADNRYCGMVGLLAMGGYLPPLTIRRTGLAQIDMACRVEGVAGRARAQLISGADGVGTGPDLRALALVFWLRARRLRELRRGGLLAKPCQFLFANAL